MNKRIEKKQNKLPAEHRKPESRDSGSRRSLFIVIGVVVFIVGGILAVPYYQTYVAPFRQTVITVDNTKINMSYFLERTNLAGSGPMSMLETLTEEQVIKLAAPGLGINITNADIDEALRKTASNGSGEISDVEYKEWYRQRLDASKLSNKQFRDLIHTALIKQAIETQMADKVANVAPQVHLWGIEVQTLTEANTVIERLGKGEDFSSLALSVSIDPSKDKGGDMGWLPPAASVFDKQIAALEINQISEALAVPWQGTDPQTEQDQGQQGFYIFKITEKDDARVLSDSNLQILKARAYSIWLEEEQKRHEIRYKFNSEIYAWMNWQLQKMKGPQAQQQQSP